MDSNSVEEVFLSAENPDPKTLMRAIKCGAKEFFCQPLEEEEVEQALEKFRKRRKPTQKRTLKSGQIIQVVGSKGGVGTTTVAVNLAVNLAQNNMNQSVAIVDMKMLFGEIPLFLEIKPNYHWGEITKDISRLDSTFLMGILSKHISGVHVLPSPASMNGHPPITPEVFSQVLGIMKSMFDIIVIDGGHSPDDIYLKILGMSDEMLIITDLTLPCLANAKRLLKLLGYLGYPSRDKIKIVINRFLKNSQVSIKDAKNAINKEIFWTVPNDYNTITASINEGRALSQIAPRAQITKNIQDLADTLMGKDNIPERGRKKWDLLSLLQTKIEARKAGLRGKEGGHPADEN
jgi:pilus assembly protein CpaE